MNENERAKAKKVAVPTEHAHDTAAGFRRQPLYSSVILAQGGCGQQALFTVPKGQAIPHMKGSAVDLSDLLPYEQLLHSERTTNMVKAGDPPWLIEDALFCGLSYDFPDGATGNDRAEIERLLALTVVVAARIQFEAPLPELPVVFDHKLLCRRDDTFEVRINTPPGVALQLSRPVLLRMTVDAQMKSLPEIEVRDFDAVPREFLELNHRKAIDAVMEGRDSIPGLDINYR